MTILITGSEGRLGRELRKVFTSSITPSSEQLDIRDLARVRECVRKTRPVGVIHAAAITGIRQCEEDKEKAWKTNVEGTGNLVEACRTYAPETYFVYISTACVFYGDRGDYSENDIPNPKNFYALTKLVGETAVRGSGLRHQLIVRTNFVAREKWPYAKAFTDRYGTYLFADDLALALQSIMSQKIEGTLHVCGREKLSMYDLATLSTPGVLPATIGEYEGPPLTMDMSLVSARINPFPLRRELATTIT